MKVGIIGYGGMGRSHADKVRGMALVKTTLICDSNPDARKAAAEKGFACVPDIPALLAAKPDAVLVVTQASSHYSVIKQCLAAGVPVLTEKPLTTSLPESRELVAMAGKLGLPLQVGFELRYSGNVRCMQSVVASGLIGTPRHACHIQLSGSYSFRKARNGGLFYEKLCHEIDLFRYWFGEPERIMACARPPVMTNTDVPDNVSAVMLFKNGAQGNILFNVTRSAVVGGTDYHGDMGHFLECILTCTNGSVSFNAWTESVEVVRFNHRPDGKTELVQSIKADEIRQKFGELVYNVKDQDEDFLRCVKEGKPLNQPASDALETMEWVALAEQSLEQNGAWLTRS